MSSEFFKTYYAPNNASLVIAGDIDLAETRKLVEKWFSEIPRGPAVPPIAPPPALLDRGQEADADRPASSCRVCTSRGTRRRCLRSRATPRWTSRPAC